MLGILTCVSGLRYIVDFNPARDSTDQTLLVALSSFAWDLRDLSTA